MITELTRRFAVGGFDLAWDEWGSGDGPPLVLCHGFSGSSHDFALLIEALAENRRVVTIDLHGHGLSSNSGVVDDYRMERIVGDLIAWLDAEVGGPVHLLGHSMGGRLAMQLALRRPDLLRSLILMDTTAWDFAPVDEEMAEMIIGFFESLSADGTMPEGFDAPDNSLIEEETTAEWRALKDERNAAFDPMAAKGLGRQLFADMEDDVGDRLGQITVPVTVIVGEKDGPLAEIAPRLAAAVADGTLIVIDGAFHSPQLTHPDEWRAAVEGHLARVG